MTSSVEADHIVGVTAITEVLGDGQKLSAVVLEYDAEIDSSRLEASAFAVTGRTVVRAYTNTQALTASEGRDGCFVVLELSLSDEDAALFVQKGRTTQLRQAGVEVAQVGEVATTEGERYAPDFGSHEKTGVVNLVVDDFRQFEYVHEPTGLTLTCNLFIPKHYDATRAYPLVTFIHDLGASGTDPMMTLAQGLGAVIWASPEEQAKHECFVLAPQYPVQLVDDDCNASEYLDVTVDLIKSLAREYSLDPERLYGTGQSGGCMSFIAIGLKNQGLLAGYFLVAGQWDPALVAPLAKENLWIVVAEGDLKAFPGMNAITKELEAAGAGVSRAMWDGRATPEEYAARVAQMTAAGANVMYAVLRKGTVVWPGMPDDGGSNHICTWRIAYQIEGIRDWLLRQTRASA